MISVLITLMLLFAFFTEPFLSNVVSIQDNKKSTSEIELRLKSLEHALDDRDKAIKTLSGKDNISLAMEVESIRKTINSNRNLLNEINALIAKDPEKILAIRDINTKYNYILKQLEDMNSDISKNEDRVYSSITTREGLIFTLLLLMIPITYKLYSSNKKHENKVV